MLYEIVPITMLKPLEKVFPCHLKNLEKMIDNDGFLLKALIVDKKTGIILEGNHRYAYLLKKGFIEVPVHFVNYNDENIRVGAKLKHRFLIEGTLKLSKKVCIDRGLSGDLFPPRTTRHFFTFRKRDINLDLNFLKYGPPVDVSHLIADVDISEEIANNECYVKEIDEELSVIISYLDEVYQTRCYLLEQIELMDLMRETVFFPGKFHPPHIGQIQTILKLIPKYKKVIVGVSEHMPDDAITTPTEILNALKDLFKPFNNVEVCIIKGILVEKKDTEGLPYFDVLLSGNPDVLDWAKKLNVRCDYIDRSFGALCSGTQVRKFINV